MRTGGIIETTTVGATLLIRRVVPYGALCDTPDERFSHRSSRRRDFSGSIAQNDHWVLVENVRLRVFPIFFLVFIPR